MKRSWIFFILRIAIALITLMVVIQTVDFNTIKSVLVNPENPIYIIIATLLLLPNLFIQWYRWHYLLRLLYPDVKVFESFSSLFGGMVIGFLTPGRIGEVSRSLFLKQVDRIQVLALIFLDKYYTFLTIFLGGIWGITLLFLFLMDYKSFIVWPLVAVALFVSIDAGILMLKPKWIRNALYNLSLLLPHREKLKRLIDCVDMFKEKQALDISIWSSVLYCVYITQFCLLAFAFQKIPWTTALTATTSTIFAKTLLPISLGDLGIREGASLFFFLKFQVTKVAAFNSALLLFLINVLIPTMIGLLFLPRLGLNNNKDKISRNPNT